MSQSSSERPNGPSGQRPLTTSAVHRILASSRRRITLDVLEDRQTPVDLGTLAAAVAQRERDAECSEEVSPDQVAISLHHVHLPKLQESGIVDYADSSNRVEAFRNRLSR